ncbi:MAG TPA: hypothetical protein VK717_01360 [Opitutaceae bacterium]|jgi:hypothetical protein|nr:hypothetical protein [Opitutaceae bacterium]
MKTLAVLLLFATPMLASTIEVHLGDSLAEVRSTLGAPHGQAQVGSKLVLFYDTGQVQLVDDRVTRSDFLSPDELAAQRAEDARLARLQAQHMTEGEALKAKKLADPAFTSAPRSYQLEFWQDFRRQYPEVSCDDEYKLALARRQEQVDTEEHAQQIADLEARVADAEDQAAQAERDAQQARYGGFFSWPLFIGFGTARHGRFHEHGHHRAPGTKTVLASPFPLPKIYAPPVPRFNNPTFPALKSPASFALTNSFSPAAAHMR